MTETPPPDQDPAIAIAGLPRRLIVLLTLASSFVFVAGLKAFSGTVGPIFLALVVIVVLFPMHGALTRRGAPNLVMDASKFIRNLASVATDKPSVVEALRNFASTTRSYFVVATISGLIVAVIVVVALLILGIPLALVWGVFSFITNYTPNIGFVLGLGPPALLAYFQRGWQLALWVRRRVTRRLTSPDAARILAEHPRRN